MIDYDEIVKMYENDDSHVMYDDEIDRSIDLSKRILLHALSCSRTRLSLITVVGLRE